MPCVHIVCFLEGCLQAAVLYASLSIGMEQLRVTRLAVHTAAHSYSVMRVNLYGRHISSAELIAIAWECCRLTCCMTPLNLSKIDHSRNRRTRLALASSAGVYGHGHRLTLQASFGPGTRTGAAADGRSLAE